jgi:hypothetical protein
MGICALAAFIIVNGPEENTVAGRARLHAVKEIEEEDSIFADYAASKEAQQAAAEQLRAQGRHPDRWVCQRGDGGRGGSPSTSYVGGGGFHRAQVKCVGGCHRAQVKCGGGVTEHK